MIKQELIKNKFMLILGMVCLTLFVLTALFPVVHLADWFGQDKIVEVVNQYLNESQQIAQQDLKKLAELGAVLSMIQSSSVGISFFVDVQVSVGELMSSFSHLIKDAVAAAVLAISTMELIKFVLAFSEAITPYLFLLVLIAGVCLGLAHGLVNAHSSFVAFSNRFAKIAVVFFLVLHLFLPYSLYGAALFSHHIIVDVKQDNSAALHQLHEHVNASHNKLSLKDRAENALHTFEKVVVDLPHKVENMALYHTRHQAISLFEYILLPMTLFALAFFAVLSVLKANLGFQKE